jgi:N6-L-threonylcarbamoyladenine synthase
MTIPQRDMNRTILALETSCDETAAAVVRGGRTIISNVVASQMDMHQRYGGIVPEVASRQHILSIKPTIDQALAELPGGWNDVDAIASTYGPGLSGALLVGLNTAKALAWQRGLPFIGINHLEAHIYANWLITDPTKPTHPPTFPCIALVVSGGHTLLALIANHGDYHLLGQTRDDAAGEAFDKVARILQLGYPGGPLIDQIAKHVEQGEVFPRAWLRNSYDFSFSGLKTAVLHKMQATYPPPATERSERSKRRRDAQKDTAHEPTATPTPQATVAETQPIVAARAKPSALFVAKIAHGFQESVVDVLVTKTLRAAHEFNAQEILLAGGVAANSRLREVLSQQATLPVRFPPIWLCTDNAAMVAAAACYRFHAGLQASWELDVEPNLPLELILK